MNANKQYVRIMVKSILTSLLMIALGVIMIVWPGTALEAAAKLIGILLVAGGILNAIFFLTMGRQGAGMFLEVIIYLIFGILILAKPTLFTYSFPVIMGLFVLFKGIGNIGSVIVFARNGNPVWKIGMVCALLMAILGALIFLHPGIVAEYIVVVTGVSLIISGAADLLLFLRSRM